MIPGNFRICFVGRKAKPTLAGGGLLDHNDPERQWPNMPDMPNTTGVEAGERLRRRRSGSEAELIGYSSDHGARLVAWAGDHQVFT